MVDVQGIFEATPICGIPAQTIARISGLTDRAPSPLGYENHFELYEPPSARREPFADAVEFLTMVQGDRGVDLQEATTLAAEVWGALKPSLSALDRPVRMDSASLMDDTEACALPALIRTGHEQGLMNAEQVDFWTKVCLALEESRIYPPAERGGMARRLRDLPDARGPMDFFEFVCSLPQSIHYELETQWQWIPLSENQRFIEWRERIQPISSRLEEALGSWVWQFSDLDDEMDNDAGHRLLVVHLLASLLPECPFVRYMLEVTGAGNVGELLEALENPANYPTPFVSHDAFAYGEALWLRVDASSVSNPKCVGLIADSEDTLFRLREHALASIGNEVRIVAPPGSADTEWCREATRHNTHFSVHHGWAGALESMREPESVTVFYGSDGEISDSGLTLAVALQKLGKEVHAVGPNGWNFTNLLAGEAQRRGLG